VATSDAAATLCGAADAAACVEPVTRGFFELGVKQVRPRGRPIHVSAVVAPPTNITEHHITPLGLVALTHCTNETRMLRAGPYTQATAPTYRASRRSGPGSGGTPAAASTSASVDAAGEQAAAAITTGIPSHILVGLRWMAPLPRDDSPNCILPFS